MKHMKRLSALLAVLLSVAVLTACGSKTPEGNYPNPNATAQKDETEPVVTYTDAVLDTKAGEGKLSFYFINVQHSADEIYAGDSTLIVAPDGSAMLIDVNNRDGGDEVAAVLKSLNITKLDYLVLTHPHTDHIAGYEAVFDTVQIEHIMMNGHDIASQIADSTNATHKYYKRVVAAIEQKSIPLTILKEGDTFTFAGDVQFECLNPPAGYAFTADTEPANNGSILLKMTWKDCSFLTGGDLYAAQERLIVDEYGTKLDVDVVKMNHHAYATSNSREWVNTVTAKVAVCEGPSGGSTLVGQRYQLSGAATFYTTFDGTVVVRTAGDGKYEVQVEKERVNTTYGTIEHVEGYLTVE